jgi:hypothetical protein
MMSNRREIKPLHGSYSWIDLNTKMSLYPGKTNKNAGALNVEEWIVGVHELFCATIDPRMKRKSKQFFID